MLTIDASGAVLELEDGRYVIARRDSETDVQLVERAGNFAALTPQQRRGLARRQARAAERVEAGVPRRGDKDRAAQLAARTQDPKPRNDGERLAAALEASGIAQRLFPIDSDEKDS